MTSPLPTGTLTLGTKPGVPLSPLFRQSVQSALITALFFLNSGGDVQQAANSANRAASRLNQACADARNGGAA
jgi:hypothetical protein